MEHAEEILKDLPKYQLYNKLNGNGDKDSYCKHCDTVKSFLTPHKGLFDLCCLFAKNLITLPTVLQDVNDENERCRYFTFWIHDNIRKLLNTHSKDQSKIYIISSRFSLVFSTIKIFSLHNNCSYESWADNNFDLWKNWKDLFDYITNYTEIQNKLNSNSSLCPKYLNYMSYIERVYENYSKECCKVNAMKCHFSFGSNPWCNQDYTLPKLTCGETKVFGDSMEGSENEVTHQHHGTGRSSTQFSLARDGDSDSNDNMPLNYSGYYVKISLGLLLSGITFTLFYMYKFTRFRNWMHTKMLRAKKIDDNIDEDAKNFLERESSSVDANLYNDDYNVKYYPS
ncbi:PIR Superfamily Protein [Plasmodium ovale wallikeri]|uniref:PIR Superfamily Protein n=1 Tax=Plasmodium ovale wallikeri TaxID=864142 RepID=A0A1A9AMU9_PLAOA|nr:PIR Superfamily Protein [Plasmodium ovale wallikeri]